MDISQLEISAYRFDIAVFKSTFTETIDVASMLLTAAAKTCKF